jgi:hypothetical protein
LFGAVPGEPVALLTHDLYLLIFSEGAFLSPNGVLSTDFALKPENCGLLSKNAGLKSKESGADTNVSGVATIVSEANTMVFGTDIKVSRAGTKESKVNIIVSEAMSLDFAGLANREF